MTVQLAARAERGYAMVALLILMAVMAVAMTVALPAWNTLARREREAELVFRGEQYARAIMLFQRKYAGTFPPNLDVLVNERFLRKKFTDPITNDDFQTINVGEVANAPQATNPFSPAPGAARPGGAVPATGRAATDGATGRAAQTPQPAGRGGFVLGAGQGGVRGAGAGSGGVSTGIMGVTSKSTDESLRVYKGGDHYNQWMFIATQASVQAGGRGANTPGEGGRGGPPGRQGGPGRGLQQPALPGTPFGTSPFGRGQQPTLPSGPGGGRGRI